MRINSNKSATSNLVDLFSRRKIRPIDQFHAERCWPNDFVSCICIFFFVFIWMFCCALTRNAEQEIHFELKSAHRRKQFIRAFNACDYYSSFLWSELFAFRKSFLFRCKLFLHAFSLHVFVSNRVEPRIQHKDTHRGCNRCMQRQVTLLDVDENANRYDNVRLAFASASGVFTVSQSTTSHVCHHQWQAVKKKINVNSYPAIGYQQSNSTS